MTRIRKRRDHKWTRSSYINILCNSLIIMYQLHRKFLSFRARLLPFLCVSFARGRVWNRIKKKDVTHKRNNEKKTCLFSLQHPK
jgi:hypothetical protein